MNTFSTSNGFQRVERQKISISAKKVEKRTNNGRNGNLIKSK
jgi:hypothetical protein